MHYSLEKVLYLSQKNGARGLHVAKREHSMGSDLARLATNAVKRGELEKVVRADGDEHYHITPAGRQKLLELQIASRLNQGLGIDEHVSKLIDAVLPSWSVEDRQHIQSVLEDAERGALVVIKKERTEQVKALFRFGVIEATTPGDPNSLWQLSEQIGKTFASLYRTKTIVTPTSTLTSALSHFQQGLRQRFASDKIFYYDADLIEQGVSTPELERLGYIQSVGQDDAYTYYTLSNAGEMLLNTPLVSSDNRLRGVDVSSLSNRFSPDMSLSEYAAAGRQFLLEHVDKNVLEGLNELHWDECHMYHVPLRDAVSAVIANAETLASRSPKALKQAHDDCLALRAGIIAQGHGVLTPAQMKTRFEREAKARGIFMTPLLADHYFSEYRRVDAPLPQPELPRDVDVTQSAIDRATQADAIEPQPDRPSPKLRPGG